MERKLLDYYPDFLKEFRDIREITETEQPEFDILWNRERDLLDDQFPSTATEKGIQRWEKILGITPKATVSLDDRRFLVLTRLAEELPYTMRMLRRQMASLCGEKGYTLLLKNEVYTLVVRVGLTAKNSYNDVDSLLKRILPANMVIDLSLLYNQHFKVGRLTHGPLHKFSHYEIRNEVIVDGDENI